MLKGTWLVRLTAIILAVYGLSGCSGGTLPPDTGQVLINISGSLGGLWKLVTGGAYLMGVIFAARAVYHLKVYGELRTMMATQTNLKGTLVLLLVASVFMYLPTAFGVLMQSSFGYSTPVDPLNYSGPSVAGLNQQAMVAMIKIVQFIGLVAFVRGWLIIAKSAQSGQQQMGGKGLTHIIGGILAINIVGTQQVISATFGMGS